MAILAPEGSEKDFVERLVMSWAWSMTRSPAWADGLDEGQVEEECGFKVAADALQLVTGYRSSVGTSGSHHTLFFAEVRSNHVHLRSYDLPLCSQKGKDHGLACLSMQACSKHFQKASILVSLIGPTMQLCGFTPPTPLDV